MGVFLHLRYLRYLLFWAEIRVALAYCRLHARGYVRTQCQSTQTENEVMSAFFQSEKLLSLQVLLIRSVKMGVFLHLRYLFTENKKAGNMACQQRGA